MTQTLDRPRDAVLMPIGRYEWERLVRRIVMPETHKLVALLLSTWADPDGSRVRPGLPLLAAARGKSERSTSNIVRALAHDWGLIEQVSRGGGRGGRGKVAEWRLTIPTDLLDRHVLLGPDGLPESPEPQPSDHSTVSPESQGADETKPADESTELLSSAHSNGHGPIDRKSAIDPERLTGSFQRLSRSSALPTTTHVTNHQTRPTPRSPTNATTDRAREPPNNQPIRRSSRCRHGLKAGLDPDGNPRCPFCRRDPQEPP